MDSGHIGRQQPEPEPAVVVPAPVLALPPAPPVPAAPAPARRVAAPTRIEVPAIGVDERLTGRGLKADGALDRPATATVLHNGVLVHNATAFYGPTQHKRIDPYSPKLTRGPILLQDHGNPVRYRNIWVREIKDDGQITLLALGLASGAQAQTTTAPADSSQNTSTRATVPEADRDFIKAAAESGHAEVQAARMAVAKSTNAEIKKYAQMLIDDHTKANAKLAQHR